jgi:PadR family transcriptional regulator, regulatory protein PadR
MDLISSLYMKRVYLGEFEEVVLLIVARLGEDAYGVKITQNH